MSGKRVVDVVGPVLSVVILAVQTYIIWNQTKLIFIQSEAAQIEQAAKLRERILATGVAVTNVKRLLSILTVEREKVSCSSQECKTAHVWDTLQGLAKDIPDVQDADEAKWAWLRFSDSGAELHERLLKELPLPEPITESGPKRTDLKIVDDKLRPAIVQCLYDPERSARFLDEVTSLMAIVDDAWWIREPLANKDKYIEFAQKFPQTRQNTQTGLMQLTSAILETVPGAYESGRQTNVAKEYTLSTFLDDFNKLKTNVVQNLNDLLNTCAKTIQNDTEAFRSLQGQTH